MLKLKTRQWLELPLLGKVATTRFLLMGLLVLLLLLLLLLVLQ
jgi:hypothetical protein